MRSDHLAKHMKRHSTSSSGGQSPTYSAMEVDRGSEDSNTSMDTENQQQHAAPLVIAVKS